MLFPAQKQLSVALKNQDLEEKEVVKELMSLSSGSMFPLLIRYLVSLNRFIFYDSNLSLNTYKFVYLCVLQCFYLK